MNHTYSDKVTELLAAARDGDAAALGRVLPLLYTELHELAHRQRARQRGPATLNTTALLHEAYEKMARAESSFVDRAHFFRLAAQAMRQILVDYARRLLTAKRNRGARADTFEEGFLATEEKSEEIVRLDEALDALAELSPRQAEVVKLRYFAGFTLPETAGILGISEATVWREWAAARAWLQQSIASDGTHR